MLLSKLIKNLSTIKVVNYKDVEIKELSQDSREVFENCLFFAVSGNNTEGGLYVEEAVKRGAVAIVCEKELNTNVPQIIVENVKIAMSIIAYEFYKPKGERVKVIGIVGTNGKTTTSFILKSILENAGVKAGVIGTLGAFYNNAVVSPELTTPDSLFLYEHLMYMANGGVKYAIIELSAHAISQQRVGNMKFEALIFTNCTHDHLDYFNSFSDYEKTKISVFNSKNCRFAVINSDDETGRKILKQQKLKVFTYGLENPSDVFAIKIKNSIKGISFVANVFDEIEEIHYKSAGLFNVYNCLSALTCACVLGVDVESAKIGIEKIKCVPGRMELIENFNGADVFIDYAHTPDGLENVLKALKEITKRKLYLVFGCGGNRDKEKRSVMGEIAGNYADFTVITSDNPRYEEPFHIISQIERGIRKSSLSYITIQNRKMAIGYALTKLEYGDTLLVAGKGAEDYQEIMGVKSRFSDKEEIKECIAKIKFGGELI